MLVGVVNYEVTVCLLQASRVRFLVVVTRVPSVLNNNERFHACNAAKPVPGEMPKVSASRLRIKCSMDGMQEYQQPTPY